MFSLESISFLEVELCIRKINNEPAQARSVRASHAFGKTELIAQRKATEQIARPEGLGTNKPEGPLMRRLCAMSVNL